MCDKRKRNDNCFQNKKRAMGSDSLFRLSVARRNMANLRVHFNCFGVKQTRRSEKWGKKASRRVSLVGRHRHGNPRLQLNPSPRCQISHRAVNIRRRCWPKRLIDSHAHLGYRRKKSSGGWKEFSRDTWRRCVSHGTPFGSSNETLRQAGTGIWRHFLDQFGVFAFTVFLGSLLSFHFFDPWVLSTKADIIHVTDRHV